MQAAEPIQFLSAVIELAKLDKHFVAGGKDIKDFVLVILFVTETDLTMACNG